MVSVVSIEHYRQNLISCSSCGVQHGMAMTVETHASSRPCLHIAKTFVVVVAWLAYCTVYCWDAFV